VRWRSAPLSQCYRAKDLFRTCLRTRELSNYLYTVLYRYPVSTYLLHMKDAAVSVQSSALVKDGSQSATSIGRLLHAFNATYFPAAVRIFCFFLISYITISAVMLGTSICRQNSVPCEWCKACRQGPKVGDGRSFPTGFCSRRGWPSPPTSCDWPYLDLAAGTRNVLSLPGVVFPHADSDFR